MNDRGINPELLALPRSSSVGGYRDKAGRLIADRSRLAIEARRLPGGIGTLYIRSETGERMAFDPASQPDEADADRGETHGMWDRVWPRLVRAAALLLCLVLWVWLGVVLLAWLGVKGYGAEPLPAGHWVQVIATAYSPLDEFTRDDAGNPRRLTANRRSSIAHPYGVAVPRVRGSDGTWHPLWAYGTTMVIPAGQGYLDESGPADRTFIADDTGGIITANTAETGLVHIDLRYRTIGSAARFGTRRIWIYVLDESRRRGGG